MNNAIVDNSMLKKITKYGLYSLCHSIFLAIGLSISIAYKYNNDINIFWLPTAISIFFISVAEKLYSWKLASINLFIFNIIYLFLRLTFAVLKIKKRIVLIIFLIANNLRNCDSVANIKIL